jgi:hypothetical protein
MFWCWLVFKNMKKWKYKYINNNPIILYCTATWQTSPKCQATTFGRLVVATFAMGQFFFWFWSRKRRKICIRPTFLTFFFYIGTFLTKKVCNKKLWRIKKFKVKHFISTCGLETLFFALCAFIHITYGTCGLEKDRISIFVSFSIKKLTVGHVSTPESKHMSNWPWGRSSFHFLFLSIFFLILLFFFFPFFKFYYFQFFINF